MCVCQVRKLEANISPIQKSNSDLSEKNRMLLAEKKLLDDDLKHWKTRSQMCLCESGTRLLVCVCVTRLLVCVCEAGCVSVCV